MKSLGRMLLTRPVELVIILKEKAEAQFIATLGKGA